MSEIQWMREFGDRLRDLLDYTNTCQEEFADAIGVSQASASRYINGLQMPDVKVILAIAYEFDWDIDDLTNFGEEIY